MGDPTTPTPADRAKTRALCEAIVESIRADERMPLPFAPPHPTTVYDRRKVEDFIFHIALEVLELGREAGELKEAARALVDCATHCRMCRECGDGPCCSECGSEAACERIADLRKAR